MKKAILAIALAALASNAFASIVNGSHDLTTATNKFQNYGTAQISACQFCHAPHNINTGASAFTASTGVTAESQGSYQTLPLWNRVDPTTAGTALAFYSNAFDTAIAVGPGSLSCLSCHDGTSDMGRTFVGTRGFAAATPIAAGSWANVGRYLGNDHPVGVNLRVGTDYASATVVSNGGLKLYTVGTATNVVECASCHDPHGTSNGATANSSGGTTVGGFIRGNNLTGICEVCHLK
jgi:hypothetical protein